MLDLATTQIETVIRQSALVIAHDLVKVQLSASIGYIEAALLSLTIRDLSSLSF